MEAHFHNKKTEKHPALFSIQTPELWTRTMLPENEGYRQNKYSQGMPTWYPGSNITKKRAALRERNWTILDANPIV